MAARAITVGEIAALKHEISNDTVENSGIIRSVSNEFFEIFNVRWSSVSVQLNGEFTSFKRTVCIGPRHLKDDILTIDFRSAENRYCRKNQQQTGSKCKHATQRRGAVSNKARKHCFADSSVLHLIEEVVVLGACALVFGIAFHRISEEARCFSKIGFRTGVFGFGPSRLSSNSKGGWMLTFTIDGTKGVECAFILPFEKGFLCLVPCGLSSFCFGEFRLFQPFFD